MSTKHKVATTDNLSEHGSRMITEIDGRQIAVFNIHGSYYALANYCVHQGGPLCEGGLTGRVIIGSDGWEWEYVDDGTIVECPWHNWKFDVTTGAHVDSDKYATPAYDVEVTDGDVYVFL